jgi:hypothetical protein
MIWHDHKADQFAMVLVPVVIQAVNEWNDE